MNLREPKQAGIPGIIIVFSAISTVIKVLLIPLSLGAIFYLSDVGFNQG